MFTNLKDKLLGLLLGLAVAIPVIAYAQNAYFDVHGSPSLISKDGFSLVLGAEDEDDVIIRLDDVTHWTFDETADALVPGADSTFDIGTTTVEVQDVFVDGTAHIDTLDIDVAADIAAGDLSVTAGDLQIDAGLIRREMTVTDNDAQNNTLSVAEWVGGITVHTSTTGGGTVTTDTATNMVAGSGSIGVLDANDQCTKHYYINDGDQTLTLAGGTGVTIADAGNTILINEAAILIFCRDSATTGTLYTVSS